jgi:aquaporin Z
MKKYIAEAVGTGILALVVGLSLTGSFPVATPVLAALTLGLFVYSIGHISGTHINPAVTIGLWSVGKISLNEAIKYVVAQIVGAGLVFVFLPSLVMEVTKLPIQQTPMIGLAELFGTAIFTFGIASVVYGKVDKIVSGLVIGGSLLLGIACAALLGSNGILNPAVAFGISSLNIMYILGPIVGSVCGMQLYRYVATGSK